MQSRSAVVFTLVLAVIATGCNACVPDVSSRGGDGERCRDDGTCKAGLTCEDGRCLWSSVDSGVRPDAGHDAGGDAGTDAGRRCAPLAEDCEVDGDCCPGDDPLFDRWCNEEGKCAACAKTDGTCASDYDCCPSLKGERGLMCTGNNVCQPICEKDTDCAGPGLCMPGGECIPIPCSSDVECPDQRCCSGACRDDCGYGTAEACAITTPGGVTFRDQKVRPHAIAWRGDPKAGAQIIPWTAFAWSSSDPDIASVDATTGEVTGGTAEGTAEITATSGNLDCGKVLFANYFPAVAGTVRVLVYDEGTGRPVEGADVAVGSAAPVKTDAAGMVSVVSGPADIHVFHPDYSWVSLVGLNLGDYVVHVRPKAKETAGGFTGEFDFEKTRYKAIQFGIAGTSIDGDLLDLGFDAMLGEAILTYIRFPGDSPPVGDPWVPLPAPLVIRMEQLGVPDFKNTYFVQGTSGLRTAWSIGGGLPSRRLTTLIQRTSYLFSDTGSNGMGLGFPWAWLSPDLSDNWLAGASLFEVIPIDKIQTPKNFDGGTPLVDASTMADYDRFPKLDQALDERATVRSVVTLPDLPSNGERCLGGLFVIEGASIPGLGLVPLGIATAQDVLDEKDGVPNCRVTPPANDPAGVTEGQLAFWSAPSHGGMEGNPHLMLVVAEDRTKNGAQESAGLITRRTEAAASTDLSNTVFPAFARGTSYAPASRTIGGPATAIPGAAFVKYGLKSEKGEWNVYAAGPTQTIPLPAAPAGLDDRAADAVMTVYAVGVKDTSLADLVSSGSGQHLNDLGEVIDAFSRMKCLKKIPADDPNYAARCHPDAGVPDPSCDPACEVR